MTVKDIFDLMQKHGQWNFTVYVDGIPRNILAYANSHYDTYGTNKNEIGNLYSVSDLFEHEVVSFSSSYNGLYVKINKFQGMEYMDLDFYKDEDGKDKVRDIVSVWNE